MDAAGPVRKQAYWPTLAKGNVKILTQLCIHLIAPADIAEFQEPGFRSMPGCTSAVVATGGPYGKVALLVRQKHVQLPFCKLSGDGDAGYTAVYHQHIRPAPLNAASVKPGVRMGALAPKT